MFLKFLATSPKFKGSELPELKAALMRDVPSKAPVEAFVSLLSSPPSSVGCGFMHDFESERVKPVVQA